MVVIMKKDGVVRICFGCRKLNAVTVTDAEPFPNADELITVMSSASIVTKLNMTKGYYHKTGPDKRLLPEPMTAEPKRLIAFSTPIGQYELTYMTFCLINASATFVRMTRSLLRGIQNKDTYIDDMYVCIPTPLENTWTSYHKFSLGLRQTD